MVADVGGVELPLGGLLLAVDLLPFYNEVRLGALRDHLVDVVEHVVAVPAAVVDDMVVVEEATVPHPDVGKGADGGDVLEPARRVVIRV